MDFYFRSLNQFLLALLTFHFSALAQDEFSKQAEDEFNIGLSLYKKAEYNSAAAVFEKVAKGFAPNQRTTAAFVMKGKSELYADNLPAADKTLRAFLAEHSSSTYTPDAYYTLGIVNLKNGDNEKACASLLDALRSGEKYASPRTLKDGILTALDATIDEHASVQTVRRLIDAARHPVEEEYLLIKLSEKEIATGNRNAARAALESIRRKFPRTTFEARVLTAERRLSEPTVLKLGLLLPLSQQDENRSAREKEIGEGLREGIETAHAELMGKVAVVLDARSSVPDPVAGAHQLAEDASTVAIIGPAFSAEAQAVTAVATQHRIPLITPTANANGIAAASEFMFQANPDIETRAKVIAQYAVKTLKLKRLAILGANEQSSKLLAESFTKEVERLGGEVVATEWYARGATNLLKQLTSLRRKGNAAASDPFIAFNESITKLEFAKLVKLGISKKLLDTLKAQRSVVNMTEVLGEDAKEKLTMQQIRYSNGDPRIDSVQRIVSAVQGIYCPIASASEISVISSQLAFYGISTKILGSGEWNNPGELNASRRYTRGVYFETDYAVDPKSSAYASFAARYMQRYNKVPSKYAILGYDTAKLILSLIQQGATTRDHLRTALLRVNGVEGLHTKFSFDKRRVNSWLHLFQFTKDGLIRAAEISVE